MKKIIIISLILCGSYSAYSQDMSQVIHEIQKLTLANDSLQKQVISPLRDSLSYLNAVNATEISKLRNQINTLEKEKSDLNKRIDDFEKEIVKLNKNAVVDERDSLQRRVEELSSNSVELNKLIQEKETQIVKEKQIAEQWSKAERDKNEILANIAKIYKNRTFDDLITESTIQSVQRDMQFITNDIEAKSLLSDLRVYFNTEKLLARKFDAIQIRNAQIQLNQIKRQSEFLDKLKENIEYYKDFNDELKKIIENLIDLDKRKSTGGDREIQKLKFNEIVSELTNYMYNYYDYGNYPYLSDIVLEVIKRKQPNADVDITDLLRKLQ